MRLRPLAISGGALTAVALFVTTIVPSLNLFSQYLYHLYIVPTFSGTLDWWWYWAGEVLSINDLTKTDSLTK